MRTFHVADRRVDDDTPAYVIAEIGHNHEGDLDKAEELVRRAAAAGASAAKLQKRDNRSLYTAAMYDEPYTSRNSYGPTYGAHREFLEFGEKEYRYLAQVAADAGIDFMSTAFDLPSVDFLMDIDIPVMKFASADLTNTPLLAYAAKTGKPMVISTGAASMEDVRRAMDTVLPLNGNVALLQCTAVYPAAPSDLNLRVIRRYREEFPETVVGYSGHDAGTELTVLAYGLGARVVEKHFTLDRTRPGSDHHFSLEPEMLATMVRQLGDAHAALGDGVKVMTDAEAPARRKMGKCLVAARALPAGHVVTADDVAAKSPGGDGLPPYRIDAVIGRTVRRAMAADDAFSLDELDQAHA